MLFEGQGLINLGLEILNSMVNQFLIPKPKQAENINIVS